ncbi:MAG: hypothetical protein ACRENG_00550 [bacterium]
MIKNTLKSWALVICAATLPGCENSINRPAISINKENFEIHLQYHFRGERVRIEIDGQTLFDKAVETNYVLSLAEIIKLEMPEGRHQIKVVVNDSEEQETTFELDCKLYIGVRYFRDAVPDLNISRGVMIEVSDSPYMYD